MTFCTSCGARVPEGGRFCENCGTAVRARSDAGTPVPPPVQPTPAPAFEQPTTSTFAQVQPPAGQPPVWAAAPAAAAAPKPKRSKRGLLTGVGGVAAVGVLGVVGFVVYDQLTGPSGGADSPEAAVLELSAAADGEDAVTALSMLPPGEVGPIVDLYEDVQSKATSTGVAKAEDPFAGFDVHLTGVGVQVEELGEDVAAVTVTSGTVTWEFDPDQLQGALRIDSDGDVREASSGSADLAEVTREATDGAPLRIMTVQRDGTWYVSPMYTLLEAWRIDQGLPSPDFSEELDYEGTGAGSATAAVEEAAQALAGYDVDAFLDLLSPDEAAALYQYRDAVMTALNRDGELAELQYEAQLSIDSVQATEGDEVDDRVPVTVRSASGAVVDDDGDYTSWTLDRNCLTTVDDDGDSDGACLDEVLADMGLGSDAAADFPALTLLTQEVDGRWYLSPLATLVSEARDAVAGMDADDVASMLGVPQFGAVEGTLTAGEAVDGTFEDWYEPVLYELDVPAGKVVSACVEGGDAYLYGPDGRPAGGSAVLAAEGGTYRALVYAWEDSGSYDITARLSDVTQVTVPGTVPAGDGCGQLVRFTATAGQPLLFDVTEGWLGSVTSPSGEVTYAESSLVPEESGDYLLEVHGEGTTSIQPLPAGVLMTGAVVNGTTSGSAGATMQVFVADGDAAQIDVYGGSSIYPYVKLYGPDGTLVDSSYGYGYSGASVYAYDAGLYRVVVSDYFGSAGAFQLSVEEY